MLGVRRIGLVVALAVIGLVPATASHAAGQVWTESSAPATTQDQKFLQSIHQVDLAEVVMGDMAANKGENQQVKELGKQLAMDHKQLDEKVTSTASKVQVTLPDQPTPDQQAMADQLNQVSGAEFDRQWVTAELEGHVQAIQMVQTEISLGSDREVTQLAQDALPTLQAHYDALVNLAQSMGVAVPQAGSSATPGGGTSSTPGGGMTTRATPPRRRDDHDAGRRDDDHPGRLTQGRTERRRRPAPAAGRRHRVGGAEVTAVRPRRAGVHSAPGSPIENACSRSCWEYARKAMCDSVSMTPGTFEMPPAIT